jgi:hypothetical protein
MKFLWAALAVVLLAGCAVVPAPYPYASPGVSVGVGVGVPVYGYGAYPYPPYGYRRGYYRHPYRGY